MKHPIVFHFTDNLILIKKVPLIFPAVTDHQLTDAISELFSTASALATIFSLNARLYDVQQALGMMTT